MQLSDRDSFTLGGNLAAAGVLVATIGAANAGLVWWAVSDSLAHQARGDGWDAAVIMFSAQYYIVPIANLFLIFVAVSFRHIVQLWFRAKTSSYVMTAIFVCGLAVLADWWCIACNA